MVIGDDDEDEKLVDWVLPLNLSQQPEAVARWFS